VVNQPASQRDDHDQAGRRGQQRQAERAVGQSELLLHRGDPGQPGTIGDAEDCEVDHDGNPSTPQHAGRVRTRWRQERRRAAAASRVARRGAGNQGIDPSRLPVSNT
jgi:hypothetical protein